MLFVRINVLVAESSIYQQMSEIKLRISRYHRTQDLSKKLRYKKEIRDFTDS